MGLLYVKGTLEQFYRSSTNYSCLAAPSVRLWTGLKRRKTQTMYADGALRWAIDMRIPFAVQLTRLKQLLAIWKRAKGKERDALRWGDEVG